MANDFLQGGILKAIKNRMQSAGQPDPDAPQVDNRIRNDWNSYLNFLDTKGLRGKVDLDKGGLGYKVFDEYVKANPTTSLSREKLPIIRNEMLSYRNWVLGQVASGKQAFAEGVTPQNFMTHVLKNESTQDPNLPGSNLTATAFPLSYMKTFVNNKEVSNENKGFATINKK